MLFWQEIPDMIEIYHQKVTITDIRKTRHSNLHNSYDSSFVGNMTQEILGW